VPPDTGNGRDPLPAALMALIPMRRGHFLLESGHHGELWLDLDTLFLRPSLIQPIAIVLARRLATYGIDAVCGPLTGGGLLAQMIAIELKSACYLAERSIRSEPDGGTTVRYDISRAVRSGIGGRRVALVDDVINAGSALRATFAALQACDATPVAIGALLTLGPSAARFAAEHAVPLTQIAALSAAVWSPATCPLCAAAMPLEDARSAG
jgi:orotate phosphoribosyltransferase